jgi:tRNA A-37 threonylcarbamoyl transferase component Bud32
LKKALRLIPDIEKPPLRSNTGWDGNKKMEKFITINLGGVKWILREEYKEVLLRDLFEKLRSLGNDNSGWVIFNHNQVRIVAKTVVKREREEGIFIKKYNAPHSAFDKVKYIFRNSKGIREWRIGNKLLRMGIPTIFPLAVGERRERGLLKEGYLFTRALDNSQPLNEYLLKGFEGTPDKDRALEKWGVINSLARLVKKIHDAGIFHLDLHSGNILIKKIDRESPSLYLIDLHRVRIQNKLSHRQIIFNLAQLNVSLSSFATRSDKFRLLKAYAEGKDEFGSKKDFRKKLLLIKKFTKRIINRHFKSRTKRCLQESSSFSIRRENNQRIYFQKSFQIDDLLKIIEKHKRGDSRLLKSSPETVVSSVLLESKERFCVKQYRYRGFFNVLKNLFRSPPARRCWINGNGLIVRKIPTASPYALVEERFLFFTKESYIIMENLSDALGIDRYFLKYFSSPLPREKTLEKKKLISSFAKKVSELHNQGIYHSDLKAGNIMVRKAEEDGENWRFYFIDNDKIAFKKKISLQMRAKNLAQINTSTFRCVNRTDKLRFFNEYIRRSPIIKDKNGYLKKILVFSRGM